MWLAVLLAAVAVLAAFPTAYWVCVEPDKRRLARVGLPSAVELLAVHGLPIWVMCALVAALPRRSPC